MLASEISYNPPIGWSPHGKQDWSWTLLWVLSGHGYGEKGDLIRKGFEYHGPSAMIGPWSMKRPGQLPGEGKKEWMIKQEALMYHWGSAIVHLFSVAGSLEFSVYDQEAACVELFSGHVFGYCLCDDATRLSRKILGIQEEP